MDSDNCSTSQERIYGAPGAAHLATCFQERRSDLAVAFARRFHDQLQPLEELLNDWGQACDASADLAQDTVQALLDGSVMCSEMGSKLISGLVIAMQNSECTSQLLITSTEHAHNTSSHDPRPLPPFELFDRQYSTAEVVQGDETPFSAILELTQDYSSAQYKVPGAPLDAQQLQPVESLLFSPIGAAGQAQVMDLDLLSPYTFNELDSSSRLNRFDRPTLAMPQLFSSAWASDQSSSASSPISSVSSGSSTCSQSPTRDRASLTRSNSVSCTEPLPSKNGADVFVLVHQPQVDSEGIPTDPRATHTVVYGLTLLYSESAGLLDGLGSRGDRVLTFSLPSSVDEILRGLPSELRVVQRDNEAVMRLRSSDLTVGGELKVFHFQPGTISDVEGAATGSSHWWRSQVCRGDHRSATTRSFWTCHFQSRGTQKRRYRVIEHFQNCRKGDISDVLREFARAMIRA